ncbi:MAG: class IIb bacteriocin, lactobin A/cerein 7B family [Oscillospiraceae bacterium]|nr:class IIb bacteriocin, lactobin A/cerein 7B family [Oscillospiraceae bacterium]
MELTTTNFAALSNDEMMDIDGGIGLVAAGLICAGCFVLGGLIVGGICFLVG